jgi:aryl sulfotransferase
MTEIAETPAGRHNVQTRMFDAARWDHVRLRDDDIIVATWAKSGTTLTQQMVAQLVLGAPEGIAGLGVSPWVDVRFLMPLEPMAEMLEAQAHRRFLKTHLGFDGLSYSPNVKYIYIGRDARDVIWSAYNHAASFTQAAWDAINAAEGPWPKWSPPDGDVRTWYLRWLETDDAQGFHDLSFWDHVQGWWDQRRRPNILLLHYANLLTDLPGQLRRLADFLAIPIDEEKFPDMVRHCGIDYMREHAVVAGLFGDFFDGGPGVFFNKGVNGRWRDLLSDDEIARCDAVAARRLSPECAHWLRTGEGQPQRST